MKTNQLKIQINKPVSYVFSFTTTPPNSTLWIPAIVKEETNEWPVKVDTIYRLTDKYGGSSEMKVTAIKINEMVEWISEDKNYHCRYTFKPIDNLTSQLEYHEWVDKGEIPDPFNQTILQKLKTVLENDARKFLLKLLRQYKTFDKDEKASRLKIIDFVKNNPRCFEHDYLPGHVTGSAVVIDKNHKYVLLHHHRKLDKWLQFGGHSDGHNNPLEVALREAHEESGLKSLKFISGHEKIFDVDVHRIPEHESRPAHFHYDIRIILEGDKNEMFTMTNESKDLKWVSFSEAIRLNTQPSFQRLIKKATRIKG